MFRRQREDARDDIEPIDINQADADDGTDARHSPWTGLAAYERKESCIHSVEHTGIIPVMLTPVQPLLRWRSAVIS